MGRMMIVAALVTAVVGGFGAVPAQARPFHFLGEGEHRGRAAADHADHRGSGRADTISPTYAPQDRLISPGAAARWAQQRYGGRVLGVELVRDGAPYYRVKLLRNGNVRVVRIAASR